MSEKIDEVLNEDEVYHLTPWGCMVAIMEDYAVDISHITPKMGEHMVEDFMNLMCEQGHVGRAKSKE